MKNLTKSLLRKEAALFCKSESNHNEKSLYGVTDGKAVGTYLEHKFQKYLQKRYQYQIGSSAKGIDFPELGVDIKVTSIKQPQSSCPFKSARQKIFGLGYDLMVFVYEKNDNHESETALLDILHAIYVESKRTGDFQTTKGILDILKNDGNKDDIIAFMDDRLLPVDDIEANNIADEIISGNTPEQGYLTISNALQWRLQYNRVIQVSGAITGVIRVC